MRTGSERQHTPLSAHTGQQDAGGGASQHQQGVTREQIATDLRALGLRAGHNVLVHSSLSSIGHVVGGAASVVQALLDLVAPDGTVVVPTLTGDESVGPEHEVVFDAASTACWTGVVPETVRSWTGAVRSLHPTHSVAAVGAAAHRLTAGHEDCVTPCGAGSPYARLAADPDGVILLLGCDHDSNTTLHHVEELAGAAYHLQRSPVRARITAGGRTQVRDFWAHAYGTDRRFGAIEPLLEQRGVQALGHVGSATARLCAAGPLVTLGLEVLRADPRFFVAEDTA
jgi:aminoglycoside 3-N-acetyltransferase